MNQGLLILRTMTLPKMNQGLRGSGFEDTGVVAEVKGDTAMVGGGLECRPAPLADSLPIYNHQIKLIRIPVSFQVASIKTHIKRGIDIGLVFHYKKRVSVMNLCAQNV